MGPQRPPLAVSSVGQAGQDVLLGKVREISEYLLVGHAGGQVREHVVDRDAHPPDGASAAALARLDGDDLVVVYAHFFASPIVARPGWHHLEHVSKRMSEIAEADESAAQNQESLVDVRPPLVAYAKTSPTRKPRQCPLDGLLANDKFCMIRHARLSL